MSANGIMSYVLLCLVLASFYHFSESVVYDPALGLTKEDSNVTFAITKFIKACIKEYQVVIFSKTYCIISKAVKQLFDELPCPYEAIDVDRREEAATILDVLEQLSGSKKLPRIFVNGQCIGDAFAVKRLIQTGEMHDMLHSYRCRNN